MANIKIGIDCRNLEGQRTGVGRYLWNLLKKWQSHSETLHIVHDREIYVKFFLYFKNEIPDDAMNLLGMNFRVLRGKSNAFFKHWLLPRAAARDKVDVLFCPDYVLPVQQVVRSLDLLCFRKRRYKTAVTIHDIIYEARPREYSWPSRTDKILLKWASKQSAKNADVIFVPSEFTRAEILKHYKVNPEKIVVTPLAPDSIFRKLNSVKDESGLASSKYILFVGSIFNRRFLPQKIQGFTQFAKSREDFTFLIVGKNHTRPYQDIGALITQANQELGREAVIWREYASDEELVYLYNGAFATLWLSSYEGFGLPVLESMACGTPVITASRRGSLPEVGQDAALYVDNPENPAEIAQALERLARDSGLYNRVAETGLAHAQGFSWQRCSADTLDNILRICKNTARIQD